MRQWRINNYLDRNDILQKIEIGQKKNRVKARTCAAAAIDETSKKRKNNRNAFSFARDRISNFQRKKFIFNTTVGRKRKKTTGLS